MWLITLFLFWKSKHKHEKTEQSDPDEISKRQSLKQIKHACNQNDAEQAKKILIDWARQMWPNERINNLNSIKPHCDNELQVKLDELNSYLYGKQQEQWDGKAFLECFESQSFENKTRITEEGKLEPLYKS